MYEAKLYTLWFIYTDKDSNNVLMCSISNMRFSNTTFTLLYCTVEQFPSSDCRCVQNHFKYGNNTFIHCVKEASDGASTDLVRDTRFPFSAAASGKPHELSHIKGNLDQIFLSVSHDDIQPLFSFISAGPCATKLCLSRLCVSFCKLAMKHHIVLTESLTPFKH